MLNFKMSELIYSEVATKMGINNTPDIKALDCMLELIYNVLQPLREKLGRPIIITSGYRNAQLNAIVGGVEKSQHTKGQAADIIVNGMGVAQLVEFIKKSGIEYDQLINERDWVHISFVRGKNRKQNLVL